jgi:hypothetical protein
MVSPITVVPREETAGGGAGRGADVEESCGFGDVELAGGFCSLFHIPKPLCTLLATMSIAEGHEDNRVLAEARQHFLPDGSRSFLFERSGFRQAG